MKQTFAVKAPAKINLGLAVLGRRRDGYHEIETVMQQVSLADTLVFRPRPAAGERRFSCTDRHLSGSGNLVCQAAESLAALVGKKLPGVDITLYKNIPVQAGLAGGSADAAAALAGLNNFWSLGLGRRELLEIAAALGSDIPYCLLGGTVLARGRGELLEQLPPLPFYWVVLALPPCPGMPTALVYRSFDSSRMGTPSLRPLVDAIRKRSRSGVAAWLGGGYTNTLSTARVPGTEILAGMQEELIFKGFNPVLSGSGPALFILTDQYSLARSALRAVGDAGGRAFLCWTTSGMEEIGNV